MVDSKTGCPLGIELDQARASAERDCLNALNAVKAADAKEHMRMAAFEKAVLAQVARDALVAHTRKCKICRALQDDGATHENPYRRSNQ